MKKRQVKILGIILISISSIMLGCKEVDNGSTLQLFSTPWSFATDRAPSSILTSQVNSGMITSINDSTSFTIKMVVKQSEINSKTVLLSIPDVLDVSTYNFESTSKDDHQNYSAYKTSSNTTPVIEGSLLLYLPSESGESRYMSVGVPISTLDIEKEKHEVVLHFSGVKWTLYIDNELVDNDFPLGYPKWNSSKEWMIDTSIVESAEIYFPGIDPQKVELDEPRYVKEIQYWTPSGHNAWVGDVVSFYHEGRYHLFYLFDRRGHNSKFGRGAHYFEHLSTVDFKTWVEHPAATPIEEQWETFGTGTPFVYNGEFCISYGLHTTRIYPYEKTSLPMLWDYYEKNGETGSFLYDTIPYYPAGSTYSISKDGISNFEKTRILYHPSENPSIYSDADGGMMMIANYGTKGTWKSDEVDGGWKWTNPTFPLGGDCTFYFQWGNYDYIIGGFTGLWSKLTSVSDENYEDVVARGTDFYNGMCVPSVTEVSDNRFIMAGWIPIANWGGTLNFHELIQYPDGRIGTKWMDEITPETHKPEMLSRSVDKLSEFDIESSSFMLTFDVIPEEGASDKIGVLLFGEDEQSMCEFQISPVTKRAQFGDGSVDDFSDGEKTLREGGYPNHARNYAIENLIDTDKPFSVRMIVKHETKFGGSQIDAEIAGQRTMISFRPDLEVDKLSLRTSGGEIKNVKFAPLKN